MIEEEHWPALGGGIGHDRSGNHCFAGTGGRYKQNPRLPRGYGIPNPRYDVRLIGV
jgi:hypothetical protein